MSPWLRLGASRHLYHRLVRLGLLSLSSSWIRRLVIHQEEPESKPSIVHSKHPGCHLHCLTALYLWKLRAQGLTVQAGPMRALMSGWASGSRLHSRTRQRKTSNYDIKIRVTGHDTFNFFSFQTMLLLLCLPNVSPSFIQTIKDSVLSKPSLLSVSVSIGLVKQSACL